MGCWDNPAVTQPNGNGTLFVSTQSNCSACMFGTAGCYIMTLPPLDFTPAPLLLPTPSPNPCGPTGPIVPDDPFDVPPFLIFYYDPSVNIFVPDCYSQWPVV